MSQLKELFAKKKSNVLNVYCTAGFPQLNDTIPVMKALQDNGADIIELGIPYSDPLADGPVIQLSSAQALANGMSIPVLFQQLNNFRLDTPAGDGGIHIPVILMGYMNPVLQYGFENFCRDAAAVGVDGLILPDLPQHEFETEYGGIIKKYGLDFIFLITPETSEERVRELDSLSSGFLYAVSSSSITGSGKDFSSIETYLQKLQTYELKNPLLVGFGISDKQSLDTVCKYASGGIIGSAYIKALQNSNEPAKATMYFLQHIRGL
jgi:tryptophan synthase alpha chain